MPDLITILTEESMMNNIWLRLPIKSTVRFRCVLKSWCASLSDPQFIYKNLTFSGAAENHHDHDQDLLLVLARNKQFYSVVSHETPAATPVTNLSPPLLADPWKWHANVPTYSCNDMVCFHKDDGTAIGVWNLTTDETEMLPPVSHEWFQFVALGFGFDDKIQDYKIVQIRYEGRSGGGFAVYVYTLRSGSNCWRKLDGQNVPQDELVSPCVAYWRSCSYRDGVFYWCDSNIASFDMSSEVFNTISIPRDHHLFRTIKTSCRLKNGSMLIVSHGYDSHCNQENGLWAWLEVGVAPSLTKLFCIDWHNVDVVEPLGFWRNRLVFDSSKGLLISDPSKRETKVIECDEPICNIRCCLVWRKGKKNSVPLD